MDKKKKNMISKIMIFVIIGVLCFFIIPVSLPLILAFLTAASFDPLVRWFNNRAKLSRIWAVIATFSLFLAFLGSIAYLFVSKGITQGIYIAERIPLYTVNFMMHWENWSARILTAAENLPLSLVVEINQQLDGLLDSMTEPLRNFDYLNFVTTIGTWIPIFLVSIIVYLIAVFLFMVEYNNLRVSFYSHLKDETAAKIRFMTTRLSSVIRGFIKAQFLVSLIIFAVSFIGLLFISPKFAFVMALIIWVIDFIPIIGSIVVLGPWALIHLLLGNTFEFTSLAVLAVILLIIRRTVEPKVMGQYIGLSPLYTLISMFIGVKLLGITGFLLGPLLVIAFHAAKEAGIIKFDFKI